MSGRLIDIFIQLIPFNVRYRIVMAEFVRTPKGDHNALGTTAEEVLRNMFRQKMSRKGKVMGDVVRLTAHNVNELATRTQGRVVTEIDPFDREKTFVALNLRTKDGTVERAHEGDLIIEHADGKFSIIEKHEVDSHE